MVEFFDIFLNSVFEQITKVFDFIPFSAFFLISCLVVFCLAIFKFLRFNR